MAGNTQIGSAKDETALMAELWADYLKDDPLSFVMLVYPWGVAGTPLANRKGPRRWQAEILNEIRDHLKAGRLEILNRRIPEMLREAVSSGRGVGKSALVGWLAHWQLTTAPGSTVIITANTENQLATKTWPELRRWFQMAINAHWFDTTATSVVPAKWFGELVQKQWKMDVGYYYARAVTWSEENPDAFAGAHNSTGMMVIFDEASGIPKAIWTVTEGFFTEPTLRRFWFAFSNPRRNSGAFFDCFHSARNQWRTRNIDARTIEENDPKVYQAIIDANGIDSDAARIEVFGLFPNQGEDQYIDMSRVLEAERREPIHDGGAPLIMGVDVARSNVNKSDGTSHESGNKTVFAFRRGRDARTIPWQKFKERDSYRVAEMIGSAATKHKVDAIMIDGNGVGGPVADILKKWKYVVIEVQASATPRDADTFANKRAEMWSDTKDWLLTGAIPDDPELRSDLTTPEYGYHLTNGKLKLEGKEDMLRRGVQSPDVGDALVLTFAAPVARNDINVSRSGPRRTRIASGMDEDLTPW